MTAGKSTDAYLYFYLPILILAICDPLAALFGKKFNYGKFKIGKEIKTLSGTIAFFISCVALSLFVFLFFSIFESESPKLVLTSLVIALCSAIIEAISGKGSDNLTIPAGVLAMLILFL